MQKKILFQNPIKTEEKKPSSVALKKRLTKPNKTRFQSTNNLLTSLQRVEKMLVGGRVTPSTSGSVENSRQK